MRFRSGLHRWLALALALGVPALLPAAAPKLTVYYYNRLPYYGETNGRLGGFLVDIARLVFDQAGISYEFVNMPVKRIPEVLKLPGNTCSIGWFLTPEREAVYTYSTDFIYQDKPFCAICTQGGKARLPASPTLRNVLKSDLELGLIDGFAYGEWLEGNLRKYSPRYQKVSIGEDSENMYQMLLGHRFDYMFVASEEAAYIVNSHPSYRSHLALVNLADAPRGNLRYLLFSRGVDKAILDPIDAAIPLVKQGKPYRQILARIRTAG